MDARRYFKHRIVDASGILDKALNDSMILK